MKKSKTQKPRTVKKTVRLVAYNGQGRPVLDEPLPFHTYFKKSHPLMADVIYRKQHRVARICGTICTQAGTMVEEFTIGFDQAGQPIGEASRLADGTLIGNWAELRAIIPLKVTREETTDLVQTAKRC